MTPQELESRCRAVGCWPEGLNFSGGWWWHDELPEWTWNEKRAHALILAELWAKMPDGYGAMSWYDQFAAFEQKPDGACPHIALFKTPLEAGLVCHEHYRGIGIKH